MTKLLYIGKNSGTSTWWGAVTGVAYKAGGNRKEILVDSRDVDEALAKWKEGDAFVFRIAPVVEKPKPVKLPAEEPPQVEWHKAEEVEKPEPELPELTPEAIAIKAQDEPKILDRIQDEVDATSGAKTLAAQSGIDLREIVKDGRISKRDVEHHIESRPGRAGNL